MNRGTTEEGIKFVRTVTHMIQVVEPTLNLVGSARYKAFIEFIFIFIFIFLIGKDLQTPR